MFYQFRGSVYIYQITHIHTPEENNLQKQVNHKCQNMELSIMLATTR
jgi:hypothetical protein